MAVLAFAAAFSSLLICAYTPFQDRVGGMPVPTRWPNAKVSWNLNPTIGSNVDTTSGVGVADAITNGANAWQQTLLNQSRLNNLTMTRGQDSTLTDPNSGDCINVISFSPSDKVSFPTGTIAFTSIVSATADGQAGPPFTYRICQQTVTSNSASILVDADMMFNPKSSFSTSTPPLGNRFDVHATASHEFGHMLGLDHSGIAHTMMFPFGETGAGQQRDLAIDDVVGVAFLYPDQAVFGSLTGTISGTVTLRGSGIFAAHVVATNSDTGVAVLDGLTHPDGTYKLMGVPPGNYTVLALPLSGVYTLDAFSGWSCGYGENSPPCCDPKTDSTCTGTAQSPPTDYSGKFY